MSLSKNNRFICNHYDWPKIKGVEGLKEIKVPVGQMKSMSSQDD